MQVVRRIEEKLRAAFAPTSLNIIDQSHLHAGHAGAPEGGESHFRVEITAPHFEGMTRVDQQRAINKVLAEELAGPVHALSLEVSA
ncbi:MAG: BolA family protein [Pseudomonadota bacterium]